MQSFLNPHVLWEALDYLMLVLKNHAVSKWHMLKYVNSGTRQSHDHVLDTNRPSREPTNSSFHELPSGKHTQNYGKSSLKQWANQHKSTTNCNFQQRTVTSPGAPASHLGRFTVSGPGVQRAARAVLDVHIWLHRIETVALVKVHPGWFPKQ